MVGSWLEGTGLDNLFDRLDRILEEVKEGSSKELDLHGVGQREIDGWKKQRIAPSVSRLVFISIATGVSLDWLAFGDEYDINRLCRQGREAVANYCAACASLKLCPKCESEK